MTDAQARKLYNMLVDLNMPQQLRYILSCMITDFQDRLNDDPLCMEKQYGTMLTRYVENILS